MDPFNLISPVPINNDIRLFPQTTNAKSVHNYNSDVFISGKVHNAVNSEQNNDLTNGLLFSSDSNMTNEQNCSEFLNVSMHESHDWESKSLLDNFWAVLDEKYLRHSLEWTITLVIAYTLILIIGIIGNLMVILVVIRRPRMRTVTNMFIMNLAVADLFVIVFCVPATLLSNIFTPWILGSVMCKGVAYVQGVSVCASAYSLAAISLDRCKAIYRLLEQPRGLSKRQALVTICFIWTISLLLTIPWAVIFNVVYSEKDGISYCTETWEDKTQGNIYFLVANLFCCYTLPLILISISNVTTWCHVSNRKVPHDSASAASISKMHRRTRHGVRKMLSIVTLAFLLSWLPLYVIVTRVKFTKKLSDAESDLLEILMPFAQWLGSWNSSINPILYAFLNSKFRDMFKSLLPGWVPFISRKSQSTMRGRGTITNGTFTEGSTWTPSQKPFIRNNTIRSSKSNESSPRGGHHYKYDQNGKPLAESSFRGGRATTLVVSRESAVLPLNFLDALNPNSRATVTDV